MHKRIIQQKAINQTQQRRTTIKHNDKCKKSRIKAIGHVTWNIALCLFFFFLFLSPFFIFDPTQLMSQVDIYYKCMAVAFEQY